MHADRTGHSEVAAARRYKTALGRALVHNLEKGIAWKLDPQGKLAPVSLNFVSAPVAGEPWDRPESSMPD